MHSRIYAGTLRHERLHGVRHAFDYGLHMYALDLDELDAVIVENIGNLVCPAEFDIGSTRSAMILSVPEGDDKPLKYPLMFSVCDVLVVNKTDYLDLSDFDMEALRDRVAKLNPGIRIFPVSCRTGQGIDDWAQWLAAEIEKINVG